MQFAQDLSLIMAPLQEQHPCQSNIRCSSHDSWKHGIFGSIFSLSMKIEFFLVIWGLGTVFWECWLLPCHLLPLPCV